MEQLLNDFSIGLFIMQAVILVILLFLLVKFAWKPIMNALTEREEGIKNALEAAEKAKKDMQNLQANNEKLAKEAREERDTILKEAREMKDQIVADAKLEASKTTETLITNAQAAIEQEKQSALSEIKHQVAELSIGIAETILKKELASKNEQLQLVEDMLKDVTLK